ncbi:hypothetical protein Q7P36_008858 [Cladosporium allicinum]
MAPPTNRERDLYAVEPLHLATQSAPLGQGERMMNMTEKHPVLPAQEEPDEIDPPKNRMLKDLPRELSKMIVIPVIMALGVCRGYLDLDNRGVRPEEYDEEVRKVLNMFGSDKRMASAALEIFTRGHTLRINAEELRRTSFSLSPTGPVLIGEQAVRLPFQRSLLGCLTVVLNAGSLSSSNTQTFADLTDSIEHIALCFPKLHTLTIDIEWEIDEVQERFAPLYTVLLEHGQAKASDL